jgi:hypothetical protein
MNTPHRMVIRKATNGGFIAEHQYKANPGGPTPDNEEFQLPTLARLKKHIGAHFEPEPKPQKRTTQQDRDEIRSLRSGRKQLLDSLPDPRREWTGRDPQAEDPRQMRQGPLEEFPMKRI